MFPTEIWERILNEIKCPEELGRLKLVCMDWNVIIEKIFQHQIQWNDYCFKKISEKYVVHLLNQITEKLEKYKYNEQFIPDVSNEIWREVYCYWKTWPLTIDHRVFIDKLNNSPLIATHEQITHLDVYRDYLGIVTSENSIYFYKISDLENTYYTIYNSTTVIAQFIFWKTESAEILALIRSTNGFIKFWDVINKIEGEYAFKGDFISTYLEKCYIFRGLNVTNVKYIKTTQMLAPTNTYVAGTNLYKDFELQKLSMSGSPFYPSCNLFTSEENQSFRTDGKFYSIDEKLIVAISGSKICFRLTESKWREYNLFNNFHGRIQYLCYHCKLLIFGLDSGTIYIFHLKNKSDLENFDFSPSNGRKIIVDTKPITAIRVIDFKKRKIIAAATCENVYFINFLSS